MTHVQTSLGQDVFHVGERLACLLLDAALGELSRGGVDGQLAGCDDDVTEYDGLTVGADGGRRFVCADRFHKSKYF